MRYASFPFGALVCPLLLVAGGLLAGCASSEATILANAPENRSPVAPSNVAVYSDTSAVGCEYTRVAMVSTTGNVDNVSDDQMVADAKEKAGEVGANALIVSSIRESMNDSAFSGTQGDFLALLEERPCN